MITEEEKKTKVLSTDELLARFNAQKAGTPGALNEELDPWGTKPVDIDTMLSGKPKAKPVQEEITPAPKTEKRQGYLEGLGRKLLASGASLGDMAMSSLQGAEALVNSPFVTITEMMINRSYKRGEIDEETKDFLMKEATEIAPKIGRYVPTAAYTPTIGEKINESKLGKQFEADAKGWSESVTRHDKSATQYLKSGQFGKALEAVSYGVAESLAPTLAAAFIPGGAAVLGVGTAGQTFDDVKDREDMYYGQKIADAVTVGMFEWLFERFGSREMGKALMDIYQKSGKEGVVKAFTSPATKNLIAKAYKKFGVWFAPVHEGISEGLTTLGQNAAAILSGEDPERKIGDGFWDSVLIGAGMGGMFSLTEKTAEQYRIAREGKAGPITGPLTIEDQDPEVMIRDLGKKYAYNGFNSELPDQNFIKYGEMKDGRKVIIKSTNFATDPANMLVAVVDAENPESKPQMVKGNMINNSMDVPYEEWVQNEMRNYQATMSQISNETAKATAPVQEGATIPIGEQLFNVTQVTDQGITLNEIDKDGNLTANTQVITPDQYGKVFGVGPTENGAPMPQDGVQQPNLTTGQPAAPAQPTEVSQQSRKVSDGKNEFTIIPQEDGNFRMSESFETQKEAETALKKLQERYPKLTWKAEMTDSGDLFTPDTYNIVAEPKKKPTAPAAETSKVESQKPAEAPVVAPEVKAESVQPVSQTPSTPDETAAEEEVQNAGEVETQVSKGIPTYAQKKQIVLDHFGGMYEDAAASTPEQIYEQVPEVTPEEAKQIHAEIKSEFEAEQEKTRNTPDPFVAIAKAEGQVDLRPTEAQKEAGNYAKGHLNLKGFDISIENPAGSVRSGVSKDGKKWSNLMNNTYGYFRRTEGKDGDQVDVFLGDNIDSDAVYIVDQVDHETGIFDEHKIMMGFNSAESARENYLANYEPGWKGLGSITKMSLEGFKEWLGDAKRTRKPVDAKVSEKAAPVEQKLTKIATPREAAIDLIRNYVLRGDSYESLKGSFLGAMGGNYDAQIGGYLKNKNVKGDQIAVSRLNGKEVSEVFSLKELFDEIKAGPKPTAPAKPQKPAEDSRPVKKLKEKKGWPMSKADEARLSREPQSFEEAVYQFFIGRGRISTASLKHHLGTRSREDYSSYIWAHKKDGQKTDKLNEAHIFQAHPELLKQTGDQQDQERAFMDILLSVLGLNDMRTRIDEMQRKADEVNAEPIAPKAEEEIDYIDAGQVVDEEILPLEEEDPEILRIFELEINELGKTLDDLKNLAANDPDYFQVFPYGLNEKQFNELKSILNDTERQKQIIGLDHEVNQSESRSEGDNEVPGSPEPESRTDGKGREEGGTEEPAISAEQLERERAAIEEWIPTSEHEDYISFDWDGESLEIFKGRDDRIIELSREQLIEEGVRFPEVIAPALSRPEFAGEFFEQEKPQPYNGIPQWIDAFNKAKEGNDLDAIQDLYNKVLIYLNGPVLKYGEQAVNDFTQLRNQIEAYAEEAKKNKEVKPEFAGEYLKRMPGAFVKASNGTYDFGYIKSDTGLKEAPIRLTEGNDSHGLLHIIQQHGKEIKDAGYKSIPEFIEEVAKNYTVIRTGTVYNNKPTYLLELADKQNRTLIVELSRDGEYWNVNSAGIFRKGYSKNKKVVWSVPALGIKQSAATDDIAYPPENKSGTGKVSGDSPQTTSEGEDIKKEDTSQVPESKKSEFAGEIFEKEPELKTPKYSPIQQKQIDEINKEYADLISKKQAEIAQAEKAMKDALLKADERNGLFGDTTPVEADEIIGRDEQGFTYNEATRAAVRKPFEEKIAGINKVIEELKREQKGKIDFVLQQQDLFAEVPAETEEKAVSPKEEEADPLKMEPVAISKPAQKIEDFGEHLAGAKKELRGQLKKHLDTTDEDILNNSISKVLPPVNYKELVDGELATPEEAAFLQYFRSEIGPKPTATYKLQRWLNRVNAYKSYLRFILDKEGFKEMSGGLSVMEYLEKNMPESNLKEVKDQIALLLDLGFPNDITSLKGYELRFFERSKLKNFDKDRNPIAPLPDTWAIISPSRGSRRNSRMIVKDFPTREEAVAGLKYILTTESERVGQVKFDMWRERGRKGIFVGKKVGPRKFITLATGFDKVSEAQKYIKEHQDELEKMLEERKIIPYERPESRGPREGKDYRGGKDVTPEMFSETFGFRGVQFGNYVEQLRRQEDLNEAYDALMDLAEVIGVSPKALSLAGELGVAFGARGSGGKNAAAAHYEPDNIVINLTKGNGPGSLAHEWFHAVDSYFSRIRGERTGFVTERPRQRIKSDGTKDESIRPEVLEAFKGVTEAIENSGMRTRARELDKLRSKDYWTQIIEMAARSFEAYVHNRLVENGGRNDYLVSYKDMVDYIVAAGGSQDKYPYPTNEELGPISEAFDNLFQTIQTREEDGKVAMFRTIGEKGASAVEGLLDNLTVAREMEQTGRSAKEVFLATGWQRGADGLWRYETRDIELKKGIDFIGKLKPQNEAYTEEVPLTDIVEDEELFNSYPELKNVKLTFYNYGSYPELAGTGAFSNFTKKIIAIGTENMAGTQRSKSFFPGRTVQARNKTSLPALEERDVYAYDRASFITNLSHELQHYIQRIEGFAEGTARDYAVPGSSSDERYRLSAGEVEARNVQQRTKLSPEERRSLMLSETEDVDREQQIILRNAFDRNESRGIVPKSAEETGWDALNRILAMDEADDQRHEVKQQIESLGQRLNTPVKVINNRNELPKNVQAEAKRLGVWENETMYGAWDEQTGTTYVLMDDLMKLGPQRAVEEGIKTVLHEAVAHKGLPILLGDRGYDNLVNEIYDSIPDDDLTLIRYQYGWTEDKRLIAEEYLGMMAEDNVNPSLFERIIAKIRQLLRKYFKVAYSKNDVYSLLRASRKNLENAPEEERGFYRSRPRPENFEYAGEFVQAQGTYFRTRKQAATKRNTTLGRAAEAYSERKAIRTGEETIQGIREYIQDISLPIRRFEEELLRRGGKQDNTSKPYRDMSLSFGRQEKLYNDYFEGKMKPILQAVADIKRAGIPGEDILPYIIAKHAMERNPAFRSRELKEWVESHKENVPQDEVNAKMEELKDKDYSGVMGFDTDKTYTNPDQLARDIVSEFEGQVDAKLIDNLWKKIGAATSEILDTWQRGHQITPEQKQEYLSQFRYFVPLRGWREGAAKELVYTKGEGFSRSLQYAKGRKSLAENPLAYLLNVQFQAIAEQVDNEVKTSMVNLIIKNLGNNEMHEMATIKKLYYVKITLPDGTEEWEPTITRPPQEMFDAGDARTKIYTEHERLRKPRQAREHEVYVRKPGGDMVMVFNGKYLSAAQAMNKQNYMYRTIFGNIYDARDLNKVMALMGHMNNMLKALYTSWNVVFPFTNFMRDFQEASITQQIKSKSGGKVIKNYRAAFPAIIRRIQGKQDLKNPMDQQLEDFYNLGGATGYTHMKSPEEIEEDINKEVARMVRKGSIAGGIGDAGHTLLKAVEHWNKIFEDATRFSVYLSSLAIGSTKEDAAIDAKEASVNFNRKGKGSKAWDAWFAFFNVAVQSMQKNFKLAKDTPKRFTQIAFSFVMLGFLEALMNALTDDEDDPDSSYYNLNPYMRQNYLVIPLPKIGDLRKKSNKYLSVPLPQFWRGFKSIGSIAFDVAAGRMKAGEAVTTAMGNFAGGLLPVDIGGFYKSGEFSIAPLVPTITKPVVELIENRNYMGYTIKKEPFTREQKKYLANASMGKDNVNPAAKFFTDLLFRWSGGDSRYKYYTDKQGRTRKVLLDVNPSTVEHLFKGYTGGTGSVVSDLITTISQVLDPQEEVDFHNTPFVNKFLRQTPPAKWSIISAYYSAKEEVNRDQVLYKEYLRQASEGGSIEKAGQISRDAYRQTLWNVFEKYDDQISDLVKAKTKDDAETTDLVIEMMDMCLGDIENLKRQYNRK